MHPALGFKNQYGKIHIELLREIPTAPVLLILEDTELMLLYQRAFAFRNSRTGASAWPNEDVVIGSRGKATHPRGGALHPLVRAPLLLL